MIAQDKHPFLDRAYTVDPGVIAAVLKQVELQKLG